MISRVGLHLMVTVGILMLTFPATAQEVVVNELLPANLSTIQDEDGDWSDWIELYNPGSDTVDASGWGLSDRPDNPFRWTIRSLQIPPGQFPVIFASGKDRSGVAGRWETIIAEGDEWRYLAPRSEPSSSWISAGFDDSGWSAGPSGFGYGDGDDATIVSGTMSIFIRRTFELDDAAAILGLYLHVDYDDGFVAYLNGEEIARANIGTVGVRPVYNAAAASAREARGTNGEAPPSFDVDPARSLLQSGTNVLAIQVHNVSAGSSDLSIIPFLTVGFDEQTSDISGVHPALGISLSEQMHTSFRLSVDETVCLTDTANVTLDCMTVLDGPVDISTGRLSGTGEIALLSRATPGSRNTPRPLSDIADPPTFSSDSGRYLGLHNVTISTDYPGGSIAFTTDGSLPSSSTGKQQLLITVTEPMALRARVVGSGFEPSPVVSRSYLMNTFSELPAVSVVTEPERLFDPINGMFESGTSAQSSFPYFGSNFWDDREEPVHADWIEADGTLLLSQGAGMKVFGGWSRGHPQKSVSFHARRLYGKGSFRAPLFQDRPFDSYETFVLRNSGNDWNRSMIRDAFMQALVSDTEIDTQAYRPIVLYINGTYWGLFGGREKINEHYVEAHGDVPKDSIDLIEYGGGPVAIHGDTEAYDALVEALTSTRMRTDEDLAVVAAMMDLDNFTDYQAAQIYYDNRDWPGNNSKLWRPRTPDGRFRWILYDTDFGYGIWSQGDYTSNTLVFALSPNGPDWPNPPWSTIILRRLMENETYRNQFANRFADLLNVQFKATRAVEVLDSMAARVESEIPAHGQRWGLSMEAWRTEIDMMRSYARLRPENVRAHILLEFGISGDSPLQIENPTPERGYVRVNRADISSASWTGRYFDGIDVPITAIPAPGYTFMGWTGASTSTELTVWIDPASRPTLSPIFEPIQQSQSRAVISEIMYHAPDDMDSGDWIEIANLESGELSIAGWSLRDRTSPNAFVVPDGTSITSGGRFVLAQDSATFAAIYPGVTAYAAGWDFGFSKSGDLVTLRDDLGLVVDSVSFSDDLPWPVEADGDGPSLELVDLTSDNSKPEAWAVGARGGSPAAAYVPTGSESPADFSLSPVTLYPNPTTGPLSLRFGLERPAKVQVTVFDLLGRRIQRVETGHVESGDHVVALDLSSAAAGPMLVRITADGRIIGSKTAIRIR